MGIFSFDDLDMGPPLPPCCFICGEEATEDKPLDYEGTTYAHAVCRGNAELIWERAFRLGKRAGAREERKMPRKLSDQLAAIRRGEL